MRIIKSIEYYDPIMIDFRFDSLKRPTGDNYASLIVRRFMVTESKSGTRKLARKTTIEQIVGKDELTFIDNLVKATKHRKELAQEYSDHPALVAEFTPTELKPYLEKRVSYAR